MSQTGTTQSELARVSGVRQPSISQTLSGRIEVSDEQLDRLLACMGHRLEVVRSSEPVDLTRSERRSWLLHRQLAAKLDDTTFEEWRPRLRKNVMRVRRNIQGQPHERNVARWAELVASGDLRELRRVLTGLDRDAIEMREVSPMSGLLTEDERLAVLAKRRR